MQNELFDEMYQIEMQHWWFVARRRIIESVLRSLKLKKDALILDAGCGNGDNLTFISKYGDVVAMERDDTALKNAQSRGIGKVFQGELPNHINEEVRKNNDLIVLLDVLEHIDDDAGSLVALRNCLKDNGKMVLTVPAYQLLWTSRDEDHHHKRRYTVTKLKELIESNGWNVRYISYFNSFLFPLALVERFKQKLFPVKEESDLKMPPNCINSIFKNIFSFESKFIGRVVFPFGLSIIVVAEKM